MTSDSVGQFAVTCQSGLYSLFLYRSITAFCEWRFPSQEVRHDLAFRIHSPSSRGTTAAVKAAFPKGNVYVDLHEGLGSIYRDDLFADFYADRGHPVEIAPWRLAVATVI